MLLFLALLETLPLANSVEHGTHEFLTDVEQKLCGVLEGEHLFGLVSKIATIVDVDSGLLYHRLPLENATIIVVQRAVK